MSKTKYKCDKEVFEALKELSEVLFILTRMANNYSEKAGEHLDKALVAINHLIK
jgi:hypothetical protein